jgi:LacI family transcriptional regulator
MAVTIKQIAELAGVAPTTVSLVLRDSSKIGYETKKRVLKIIEEMDYYPNHSGKLLKLGRTNSLAVLSSYFQNIFKMEFVNGVEQAIFGSEWQLRLFYSKAGQELEKCKEILFGQMADLVIALSVLPDIAFLEKMKAAGKPIILIEDVVEGFAGVAFDNRAASKAAVAHLLRTGRRKVAICLGLSVYKGHCFVEDRYLGYLDALKEAGVDWSRLIELKEYSLDAGREVLSRLGTGDERPDALFFASGDITAAGFLQAAKARGLSVPADIAVMGFDDSIIAQSSSAGLSTVRQPVLKMGRAAYDLALSILSGESGADSRIVRFQPELVIRETA